MYNFSLNSIVTTMIADRNRETNPGITSDLRARIELFLQYSRHKFRVKFTDLIPGFFDSWID